MAAKRALIVDDSRSARVILSRMLEGYGLIVETAETAEQALEQLPRSHPDVIFMDHLMPGMDGLQAVQAIKADPQTAVIPVVMYTSQEGELYVSQARALGAVGVLPKTVKQVDVSKLLYQLHLLPDRRSGRSALFANAAMPPESSAPAPLIADREPALAAHSPPDSTLRPLVTDIVKEQHAELRRFLLASFEAFARRLTAEIRSAMPPPAAEDPVSTDSSRPPRDWFGLGLVAALALVPTIILGVMYYRATAAIHGLVQTNASLGSTVAAQRLQLAARQSDPPATGGAARPAAFKGSDLQRIEVESVPYGETPLGGARVERLKSLIESLGAEGFRGTVQVESYVGDFCLAGSGLEGYSIAPEEGLIQRCDLIGNPYEDSLSAAQRQSLAFANLVATSAQGSKGAVQVQVVFGGRRPATSYPDQRGKVTAGEWNRIASINNRVEFTIEPAG